LKCFDKEQVCAALQLESNNCNGKKLFSPNDFPEIVSTVLIDRKFAWGEFSGKAINNCLIGFDKRFVEGKFLLIFLKDLVIFPDECFT
jgi:hypothetical protein